MTEFGENHEGNYAEEISNEPPSPAVSHSKILISEAPQMECFGTRHVLALLGFLGFANVYAMRVNLSVAIVAMVNSSAIPQHFPNEYDVCPTNGKNETTTQDGDFLWDEATQGIVLGSFFWGYIFTNPIGGRLGEIYGGKRVFCFGVFITSILTLLTPIAANTSLVFLVILRVIIGLGEGVTFPAMNSMMAKWVPPFERSQTSSMVYTGGQFGIIIALPICGILCESTFLGGWPSTFYVFGILGLIWCFVWMYFISDSPHLHPRISEEEKIYIESSLNQGRSRNKPLPIPFRQIATSLPFWATLVAHVSQNWGFYFLLTELPTYMKNILHFNIRDNSFLSALPYLATWIFSLFMGFLADRLRSTGTLSTTSTRRIFNSIGFYSPMICLVLVGYSGCNTYLTVALLTAAVGFTGAQYSGYMNSHLDMAPNYAGTLMGLTNCIATIPGFVAPIVVGSLINGQETLGQWRIVFWIAGIIYFIGNTFYIVFISGEEQPWNRMYEKEFESLIQPSGGEEHTSYGGSNHAKQRHISHN